MQQNSYEIIILKPTRVFFAFLAAQLPKEQIPNPKLLNIDSTAYIVKRHDSDEETLAEIEKHFTSMFHHEIGRWFGTNVHHEIETNFLDFLCCFKFEMHNHILLMEPTIEQGQQLILLKPRAPLLQWLKSLIEEQEDATDVIEQVTLSHLEENATVLIKNFANFTEIRPFIKNYYSSIFSTCMNRMVIHSKQWPGVNSFHDFNNYFAIEIHTQLIHLSH